MNGQLYQIATIVAAGKRAMQAADRIRYIPSRCENSNRFVFLPQKGMFRTKKYTAQSISEWFEQLKKNGLEDMKLLCPYSVKDRGLLGFSNTTESSILCFFKHGRVTCFTADWQFDSLNKQWNILYTEQEWPNPPDQKPRFQNNTESFHQVLLQIRTLATQIECENFAHIFNDAISILEGKREYPDKKYGLELPQIPSCNLQIFEAASLADVFGAMGSWNDEPPYMAHEKGLDKEYEELSAKLLKNVRLAVLYAINEW